jgi:hypothetical protein
MTIRSLKLVDGSWNLELGSGKGGWWRGCWCLEAENGKRKLETETVQTETGAWN